MKRLVLIAGLFIFLSGCVEEFDPDINRVDPLPVVIEGVVTTQPEPYTVTVSRARPIDGPNSLTPISGARVIISDDLLNSYELVETFAGNYETSAFTGLIGRSYKVRVELENTIYESAFEEVLPAFPMTGISAEFGFEDIQTETGEVSTEPLVKIFTDLTFPEESYFSRFTWEATYQIQTPRQGTNVCWENPFDAPSDLDPTKVCYITESSEQFLQLFSNERLAGNELFNYEVYQVNARKRFQQRYSPLIRQYRLTEQAYEFYEQIRQLTENTGSLFDAPPTPIQGNIREISDGNSEVLGYFSASDVVEYRDFLPSSLVSGVDHFQNECESSGGGLTPPIPPPVSCCECTFLPNSSDVPPEFWIP